LPVSELLPPLPEPSPLEQICWSASVDDVDRVKRWLREEISRRRIELAGANREQHAMEDEARARLDSRVDRWAEQNGNGAARPRLEG